MEVYKTIGLLTSVTSAHAMALYPLWTNAGASVVSFRLYCVSWGTKWTNRDIAKGCILWLPLKYEIRPDAFEADKYEVISPDEFNHPILVLVRSPPQDLFHLRIIPRCVALLASHKQVSGNSACWTCYAYSFTFLIPPNSFHNENEMLILGFFNLGCRYTRSTERHGNLP